MIRYPVAEYDRPEGRPPADAWFWSVGDRWVAVVADHERSTWWGFGVDERPAECPARWEYPIDELPPFGTLVWADADGVEHVQQLPFSPPVGMRIARYTVIIDRPLPVEDFHKDWLPEGHDGTDEAAIAQLARELQEGWDVVGIGGDFRIIGREVLTVDQ